MISQLLIKRVVTLWHESIDKNYVEQPLHEECNLVATANLFLNIVDSVAALDTLDGTKEKFIKKVVANMVTSGIHEKELDKLVPMWLTEIGPIMVHWYDWNQEKEVNQC